MDTGKYCFGHKDVMYALENGAVDQLIVHGELECERYELENTQTGATIVKIMRPDEETNRENFVDRSVSLAKSSRKKKKKKAS